MNEILFRAVQPEDFEGVIATMVANDRLFEGEAAEDDLRVMLRNDWDNPAFNIPTDAWVAVAPGGQIVGYELAYDFDNELAASCDGYVHPDYFGRGVGTRLLALAEKRVRAATAALPPDRRIALQAATMANDDFSHQLFADAGFAPIRHFWQMRVTHNAPPAAPVWPEGISVRQFVVGQDELATYEMMEEAFADHWGHTRRSFEEWKQSQFDRDDFDPSLWFLAYDGDELAGGALCFKRADIGWVRGLGVRRPWRQRGLGMALLQHGFGALYARDRATVGLGVDASSLTGATRLYERAGMQIFSHYIKFEKVLREGKSHQ